MAEKVLDLRDITSLCGDYSVHLLSALEELDRGDRLRVIVPAESRSELEEAVRSITGIGAARLVEEGEADGAYYVVLERL